METVKIDIDTYIDLLGDRRRVCREDFKWSDCPDCVWDYTMELIRECGIDEKYSDPKYVVDNLIVNGDYGDFDLYKNKNETDEDFIKRVEDDVITIFPEERIVVYSLGF